MMFLFKFIPFDEEYQIKECAMLIEADTRKDAEIFMIKHKHKFFDSDFVTEVEEVEK